MRESGVSAFQKALLAWFDRSGRNLPWRVSHTPYETWVSEVMLQQTQVNTMLPFYKRWMNRFPDVGSVAVASEDELLLHWEGLGYYSRVRNMKKAAMVVIEKHGGTFPGDHESLLALPGVGRYTAGAIMSLAWNRDFAAVDGNVERVLSRLYDLEVPPKSVEGRSFIKSTATDLIPPGQARKFNQAVMDLGAMICLPKNPLCDACPVVSLCESHRSGTQAIRPVSAVRRKPIPMEVSVGVIVRNGRVFVQKRPGTGLMPHLWEFPGGRLEPGELPAEAVIREVREELGIGVRPLRQIARIGHSYTSFRVTLHAFLCELVDPAATPVLNCAVDSRWATLGELSQLAFPAANRRIIDLLTASGNLVR